MALHYSSANTQIIESDINIIYRIKNQVLRYLNVLFEYEITDLILFDKGAFSLLYRFQAKGKSYILKLYKQKEIQVNTNPLPPSEYYLSSLANFKVDGYQLKVFELLEDYENLSTFMKKMLIGVHPCYVLDSVRWKVIHKLIQFIDQILLFKTDD
jgi:hypothetical protein